MVKKKNNKPFLYIMPFYKCHVYFVTTVEDYNKLLKKLGFNEEWELEEEEVGGRCLYKNNGIFIVGVFSNSLNILVHELSHLMIYLYEHIGSKINNETTEQFAYQLGDMTEIFYEKLKSANWQNL